jgi:hypothetical protein
MKISPALYHLWGDDAARAVVLMALEFSLGRLDPLLHGVHVEARALLQGNSMNVWAYSPAAF